MRKGVLIYSVPNRGEYTGLIMKYEILDDTGQNLRYSYYDSRLNEAHNGHHYVTHFKHSTYLVPREE